MKPQAKKLLTSYLVALAVLSAICITIAKSLGAAGMAAAGAYMLVPALAATATYLLFDRSQFKKTGIRFGSWRSYAKYYGLALLITAVEYGLLSLLSAVKWDFSGYAFIDQMAKLVPSQDIMASFPAGVSIQLMLALFAIGGLTVFNIMPGLLSGFGEEYGWRGLMFPALHSKKPWHGYVIGGTIWYVWHLPLMLLAPPQTFSWTLIGSMVVAWIGTIAMHIFLCRAYAESGSIFVSSLTHATFNNATRSFAYFAVLTNQLLGNIVITLVMLAMVLWQTRRYRLYTSRKSQMSG